jgi:hypothetical protein
LFAVLVLPPFLAIVHAGDSLHKFAGLTPSEWQAVERGKVIAKVVDTRQSREVAVTGVARVPVSRECFLSRFRAIATFKESPAVLEIGKFSSPINPRDLDALTLDPQDAEALRYCRPGSCSVKAPSRVITRLSQGPRDAARGVDTVNAVFREELLSYLRNYLSHGDQALIRYHDKEQPVSLAEQFHALLDTWTELKECAPQFSALLTLVPGAAPNVEEFFYWSKETFGLKPVISLTHVIIYQQPHESWIASKQIYANHYFDASLGITLVSDDPADPSGNSIYLAYSNRSRIDLLGGLLGALRRSMIHSRLESGMRKNLQQTIAKLESSCQPPGLPKPSLPNLLPPPDQNRD